MRGAKASTGTYLISSDCEWLVNTTTEHHSLFTNSTSPAVIFIYLGVSATKLLVKTDEGTMHKR